MRWGVVHLLHSFSCLAPTQSMCKFIYVSWEMGRTEVRHHRPLRWEERKAGRWVQDDRSGVKNISDFIVVELCGLRTFHCTWISNSPVRWYSGTITIHFFPMYIYSVCLMWQVVLGVTAFIRGMILSVSWQCDKWNLVSYRNHLFS